MYWSGATAVWQLLCGWDSGNAAPLPASATICLSLQQSRPSTHQLSAKYAAMLPLAAMDPAASNKHAAARYLRDWVHRRRAHVQQLITAAAAAAAAGGDSDHGTQGGGSTMQDLPEMLLPYGVLSWPHHPDFPEVNAHWFSMQ